MAYLILKDTETIYGKFAVCWYKGYLISAPIAGDLFAGSVDANGNYTNIDSDATHNILSLYSDDNYIYAGHIGNDPGISVWTFNGTALTMVDDLPLAVGHEVRDIIKGSGNDVYWGSFSTGAPNSGTLYKGSFNGITITQDFTYGGMFGRPYSVAYDTVSGYVFTGNAFEAVKAFSVGGASFTLLTTLVARDRVEGMDWIGGVLFMADLGDGAYAYTFNGSAFSLIDSITTSDYTNARCIKYNASSGVVYVGTSSTKLSVATWNGSVFATAEVQAYSAYHLAYNSLFVATGDLNNLRIYSIVIIADFSGTPTVGSVGSVVTFTDVSSPTPTSWLWNFGDGGTSTEQNPTHIYTSLGTYTVSLSINGGVATETKPNYILIMPVTRKFWVANNILSPWDSSNWSYLSGGPAGAPVPGSSDIAVFDSSSIGSCLTSSEVNIAGLELQWGFHSSVIQGPYPMTIGLGNMILDGGVFPGASHDITVMGSFYLTASEFKSTQGILDVRNEFYYYDTTVVPENLTEIYSDEFPLTALDIQNKYITLDPAKIDDPTGNVAVNIVGGGSQYNGVDYFIDENLLRWDGMELEGKLIEGDILRVIYDRSYEPGSFYHCNGKVKIRCTGNRMHGGGAHFYDLEFSDIEHQISAFTTIDSSCYVSHYLFLSSGGGLTEGNGATIFLSGDMTGASTFGSLSRQNNALIDMTSSRVGASPTQRIFWEDGAVFPSLIIDKHNPAELPYRNVRAIKDQTGDLIFSGNVTIHDGTFNLCGHNLRVGILNV